MPARCHPRRARPPRSTRRPPARKPPSPLERSSSTSIPPLVVGVGVTVDGVRSAAVLARLRFQADARDVAVVVRDPVEPTKPAQTKLRTRGIDHMLARGDSVIPRSRIPALGVVPTVQAVICSIGLAVTPLA